MHTNSTVIIFASIVAGILSGLPALLIACAKRRLMIGVAAFATCLAGGFYMGMIIAAPIGLFSAIAFSNLEKARRRH